MGSAVPYPDPYPPNPYPRTQGVSKTLAQHYERVGLGVVDHAQINHQQTPTINLGMAGVVSVVVVETDSILVHSGYHSFRVIPGTILVEFGFCSKFCWNQ